MGRIIVSVPSATNKGSCKPVGIVGDTNGFIISLQQVGGRGDLYKFNIELGEVDLALLAEENTDHWRRSMGYFDARGLEPLNKINTIGVGFSRVVSPCNVCSLGKSIQLHRKEYSLGLRADGETEHTRKALRKVCRQAETNLHYAAVNTRWQLGVSKHGGKTLAGTTKHLLGER